MPEEELKEDLLTLEKKEARVFLKYDPRRVKKDVLYKPLFRIFRTLLRNCLPYHC
jgi:hypothetical protein